jgi:thioredoxin 1
MSVVELNDKNFEEEVVRSSLPVLVDFFAEWCGPCKLAAPVVEELSVGYQGKVSFGKVNVDESGIVASRYGVMSIPTVIMFVSGKEVDRQVGFGGKEGYESMIKKVIGG